MTARPDFGARTIGGLTLEQRRELCGATITLDGQPAQIVGARLDFATVRDRNGRAFEWAWEIAARLVGRGGAFKS